MTNGTPPQQAIPAETLEYSHLRGRVRPGMITAVGVISIVIGCLGVLGGLGGVLGGIGQLMMSRGGGAMFPVPATMPATAPTTAAATTAPGTPGTATFSATSVSVGPGGTTVTTTANAGGAAVMMPNPFAGISPAAAALSIVTSLLSLGLAIYLIVIGIMTLRDSPHAVRLHGWYVAMKIPLVLVSTALGLWLTSGMMQNLAVAMPPGPGGGPPPITMSAIMIISAVLGACVSLAYPVGLIFVLRSKAVREYYSAIRG